MIRLALALIAALALQAPALAAPPSLDATLELLDDHAWDEAGAALRARRRLQPDELALIAALHELGGRSAAQPGIDLGRAAAALRAELARIESEGEPLGDRARRFATLLIAGAEASLEQHRPLERGAPWERWLQLRRALLEPAFDAEAVDRAAREAIAAAGRGPGAIYLLRRASTLEVVVDGDRRGLSAALRRELLEQGLRRAAEEAPALRPFFGLALQPQPDRPEGSRRRRMIAARSRLRRLIRSDFVREGDSGRYSDDVQLLLSRHAALVERLIMSEAGRLRHSEYRARLQDEASDWRIRLRRTLSKLARRDGWHNTKLPAYRALYEHYRSDHRQRRWSPPLKMAIGLLRDLEADLAAHPQPARLASSAPSAFDDARRIPFLVGDCLRDLREPDAALAAYEQAFAAHADAPEAAARIPDSRWATLAQLQSTAGSPEQAFASFDRYASQVPGAPKGTWFLYFLRAAPLFVACVGINSLHMLLLMSLAGVLLFSRASHNRPHFKPALLLAVIYAAGVTTLLAQMELTLERAVALALAAGAMVFMPTATGAAHWRPAGCAPDGGWRLGGGALLAIALALAAMAAWTYAMLRFGGSFSPHPFYRFLKGLPMYAPVAEATAMSDGVANGLLLVSLAGLQEEVLYRGFTLPLLARYLAGSVRSVRPPGALGWTAAQLLTALFFATAHAGITQPQLWKFAHVFVLSLVLGELFRRRGLLACIAAHSGFNVGALCVQRFLLPALGS